jgi:hypothetical protein
VTWTLGVVTAACTPASSAVTAQQATSGAQRQTWTWVGSSPEAVKVTTSASARTTERTCTPGGLTTSPSTSRARDPSGPWSWTSSTVTSRDPAHAGLPGTSSIHVGSSSSRRTEVRPVDGSAVRIAARRWSRDWTCSVSGPSPQLTRVRYGSCSRSQETSIRRPPSIESTASRTSALRVPAAGYRIVGGVLPGSPGSPRCHVSTSDSSTRHTATWMPSAPHQWPRPRPISSAAMNSARPQAVPSSTTSGRVTPGLVGPATRSTRWSASPVT